MTFILIGLIVAFVYRFADGMKTIPPDEIISILDRGAYNKNHLPTLFVLNANRTTEKILRGPHGYQLRMEHFQSATENKIRFEQKDPSSAHLHRIVMSRASAIELSDRLAAFLTYMHLNDMGVLSDGLNRTTVSNWLSSSTGGDAHSGETFGGGGFKQENLHSSEIRVDPLRRYFINFLRKTSGTLMLITESRGKNRRATISIPFSLWYNVSELLDEFVSAKFVAPPGPPTDVVISIYIEGMSSFRAQSMDFHVDIYLAEDWNDPRFKHRNQEPALLRDWPTFERMWHPDLYFANAKEAKYHTVTAQNFGVFIYPNGNIHLDIRFSTQKTLHHTALHTKQRCHFKTVSGTLETEELKRTKEDILCALPPDAYDSDHLNITWKSDENITKNEDILLPDMHLEAYKADYCDGTYTIGIWSCARASFRMKREIMHHVLQSYIPTALIVVISWFSFWLDADSVPGRVSLCITTLLTLATQAQAAKMSLPQVSYAKAIDVWMGVCMAFVFGVMIEFTVVNYISRRTAAKQKRPPIDQSLTSSRRSSSKRRRSSLRRFSSASSAPSATPRCLPEFHNLYFDITTAGVNESAITTPMERESNGYASHHHCGDDPTCQASTSGAGGADGGGIDAAREEHSAQPQTPLTPEQQRQRMRNRKLAARVDGISRYIFPFSFILFNAIYWPFYMRGRDYVNAFLVQR